MEAQGLAFGLIALGFLLIWWGKSQFSKKDGRTKTGYKDNVLPKTGKGYLLVTIGVLLLLTGAAGLHQ